MTNSPSKETTMIFTSKENFINFPLIVSHSNYKRIGVTSEEVLEDVVETDLIGFEFEKHEDAAKYKILLDQLGISHTSCKFVKLIEQPQSVALTVEMVKALRNETGLSMMECKKALSEANGDSEIAKTLLRSYGRNTRLVNRR